jgi:uncharacterized protein
MQHPIAEYVSVDGGYRLCLTHRAKAPRGIVVHAHAFGEEMNKTRRMAALMSRRLAEHGWTVVQIDLAGCGDSSGDFADATLSGWGRDLQLALQRELADTPEAADTEIWLWAVRGGALLLPPLLEKYPHANLLLWQPSLSGPTLLAQFLRLKIAAVSIAGGERTDGKALRRQLTSDRYIDVAGYRMTEQLAAELDGARLDLPDSYRGRVVWLESQGAQPGELSPLARAQCTRWIAAGHDVTALTAPGPPFWQTQETTEAPAFIEDSLAAIESGAA